MKLCDLPSRVICHMPSPDPDDTSDLQDAILSELAKGNATELQLAEKLGETKNRVKYHVRMLRKSGQVVITDSVTSGPQSTRVNRYGLPNRRERV